MKIVPLIVLVLFFSVDSGAKPIAGVQLFAKCYMQLTGKPLPLAHPWKAQILNGTLAADRACGDLLDKAQLDSSGMIVTDAEAKSVLNYLYEFHRSWFDLSLTGQIEGFAGTSGNFSVPGTGRVFDTTEPALALTYNLFSSGQHYKNVLRDTNGYLASREIDPAIVVASQPASIQILFRKSGSWSVSSYTSSQVVLFPSIQKGELIGIAPQPQNIAVPDYWVGPPPNPATDPNTRSQRAGNQGAVIGFNFFQNAGGGILGSTIQMLVSWGHNSGLKANGSLKMPRRWIKHALNSMMCIELPALRESDVQQFVDSSGGADVAPFREGTSCLQCHATMDQLASVGRNYFVATTDFGQSKFNATTNPYPNGITSYNSYIMGHYPASIDQPYSWQSTPVTNFHLMTPRGKLYFRSVNGTLVNKDINGIQEAGEAMSDTDDYYQCAAKRYFEYLTGNVVPLYDRGDPRFVSVTQALSAEAIKNRLYVEKLARDLRTTGSLRSMIKEILESDYYKESR